MSKLSIEGDKDGKSMDGGSQGVKSRHRAGDLEQLCWDKG